MGARWAHKSSGDFCNTVVDLQSRNCLTQSDPNPFHSCSLLAAHTKASSGCKLRDSHNAKPIEMSANAHAEIVTSKIHKNLHEDGSKKKVHADKMSLTHVTSFFVWATNRLTSKTCDNWHHLYSTGKSISPFACRPSLHCQSTQPQHIYPSASSVQYKMVSMRSENPICAPPRLSDVSPTLPSKWFQCSSDWRWPSLVLSRKIA